MRLDLSKLFDNEETSIPFSTALDLPDVVRFGRPLFKGPVTVSGQAVNHLGIVQVDYTAQAVLDMVCDRCLASLTQEKRMSFSHTLVLSLNREDNDEFIVIPDGQLDLAELCAADILLELPTKVVCSDDCQGLCPICGKDLSEGDCGCDRTPKDPRLDALRALLKED